MALFLLLLLLLQSSTGPIRDKQITRSSSVIGWQYWGRLAASSCTLQYKQLNMRTQPRPAFPLSCSSARWRLEEAAFEQSGKANKSFKWWYYGITIWLLWKQQPNFELKFLVCANFYLLFCQVWPAYGFLFNVQISHCVWVWPHLSILHHGYFSQNCITRSLPSSLKKL